MDWVTSSSRPLNEPPEKKAIAAYDNYYGVSPHRLITFDFASQAEADTYFNREEIKVIDIESDNRAHSRVVHTFELRAAYVKEE